MTRILALLQWPRNGKRAGDPPARSPVSKPCTSLRPNRVFDLAKLARHLFTHHIETKKHTAQVVQWKSDQKRRGPERETAPFPATFLLNSETTAVSESPSSDLRPRTPVSTRGLKTVTGHLENRFDHRFGFGRTVSTRLGMPVDLFVLYIDQIKR